jgi:hypothetical protein
MLVQLLLGGTSRVKQTGMQSGVQDRALHKVLHGPTYRERRFVPPESRCKTPGSVERGPPEERSVGRRKRNVLQSGGEWGTLPLRSRSGVAGLLPLRLLGSTDSFA